MGRNPPSLKLRQQAQNGGVNRKDHRKEPKKLAGHKDKEKNQARKREKQEDFPLYPGGDTAFKALLSARFCAAIWSNISDCDETYNYWEPMHYLIFGKGLQTWEYSPEFALRSYTYLMVHATPAYLYHKILQPNPLLIFYLIRCVLGLLCSFVEVYFYRAVCREFGVQVGRIWLAFELLSAGMFISSSAFLPSSFAMYTFTAACWAWWTQKYPLSIFLVALGAFLGWPFAVVLGVPIGFDIVFRCKEYKLFVQWSVISALVILAPMVAIDSMQYGRLVIAPLNIVKYNVFGGAGPNLYGTEPFSYYFVNGFLNFNFIWILALTCPGFLFLQYLLVPAKHKKTLTLPYYISLSPLFLWLAVFMVQPHKEERFLFPVYPFICLCGAISVDVIQKLYYRLYCILKPSSIGTHYLEKTVWIMVVAIVSTGAIGISRMFALYQNYHAPFDLLMELNRYPNEGRIAPRSIVNVCIGKDWHRYPSSFFLPNPNWSIKFIKSEFDGMMPAPYAAGDNATQVVHPHFNDRNQEVEALYFDSSKCHFMLDLDVGRQTQLEPIYARQTERWKFVKGLPFLDAQRSHPVFRAFYIPFLSQQFNTYGNFTLLQKVAMAKPKAKNLQ